MDDQGRNNYGNQNGEYRNRYSNFNQPQNSIRQTNPNPPQFGQFRGTPQQNQFQQRNPINNGYNQQPPVPQYEQQATQDDYVEQFEVPSQDGAYGSYQMNNNMQQQYMGQMQGYPINNGQDFQNQQQEQTQRAKKKGLFSFLGKKEQQPDMSQVYGNMNGVSVYSPKSIAEIAPIVDSLKRGKAVVVNFSTVDVKYSQRCLDYLFGACYALNGCYYSLENKQFLFTPYGVSIQGPMK